MKKNILSICAIAIAVIALIIIFLPKATKVGSGYMAYNDLGSSMSVSTSSVVAGAKILSKNSSRQYVYIQNGAVASYLRFEPVTTTNAIYLAANGSYVIDGDNLYTGDIWATSTAGATVINVIYK